MEEKERYVYHEVSNEVDTYECYWDNQEHCELFDDEAVLNRLNEQDYELKKLNQENIKLIKENQQLKQQLHDLPKKIVEEITNELSNNTSLYFEMRESTSAHCPNKEYEWFNYVRFRNYINAILKKYGGENDL